ncbi:hypothetical protein Dimus_030892, partial [Dionaea muscipula]
MGSLITHEKKFARQSMGSLKQVLQAKMQIKEGSNYRSNWRSNHGGKWNSRGRGRRGSGRGFNRGKGSFSSGFRDNVADPVGYNQGQLPPLSICTNESKRAIIIESRYQLIQPPRHDVSWSCLIKGKISRYPIINGKFKLIVPFAQSSDSAFQILSLSDIIQQFYACINKKDMHGIGELISDDCRLEDYSFPGTLQGKKDTLSFFHHLTESMGKNVRFRIGHVYEGYELNGSRIQSPLQEVAACLDAHKKEKGFLSSHAKNIDIAIRRLPKDNRVVPKESEDNTPYVDMHLQAIFGAFHESASWVLRQPMEIHSSSGRLHHRHCSLHCETIQVKLAKKLKCRQSTRGGRGRGGMPMTVGSAYSFVLVVNSFTGIQNPSYETKN